MKREEEIELLIKALELIKTLSILAIREDDMKEYRSLQKQRSQYFKELVEAVNRKEE